MGRTDGYRVGCCQRPAKYHSMQRFIMDHDQSLTGGSRGELPGTRQGRSGCCRRLALEKLQWFEAGDGCVHLRMQGQDGESKVYG